MCEYSSEKGKKHMEEYITFKIMSKEGIEVEMAVVDEFDYEHKHYVAASKVVDDTIDSEGMFIFRAHIKDEEFIPEKITDVEEYQKIAQAYMEMDNQEKYAGE